MRILLFLKNLSLNIFKKALENKLRAGAIAFVALLVVYFGGRLIFGGSEDTRYLLARAEVGTLTISVSGTGQVSVTNQLEVRPKTSGEIIYVGVKDGQEVKAGTLIALIDPAEAQKAVRDAEIALQRAQLELARLNGGSINQENDNGFNAVADVFNNLPSVVSGLKDIIYATGITGGLQNNASYYGDTGRLISESQGYDQNAVYAAYESAKISYEQIFLKYKSTSRFSDETELANLVRETYEMVKKISEAVKETAGLVQFYQDQVREEDIEPLPISYADLSNLNSYITKTNGYLKSLNSARESLAKANLDVTFQDLSVQQAENSLADAKRRLSYNYVRAPFDGLIAKVYAKHADAASSGSAVATLITKEKIAELSLNEVDAAKVRAGQKSTLTFDAIPDLRADGEVISVDTLGTISQGVVTYNVKISFRSDDQRVKPSMSISADIVAFQKENVLLVPSAAVKQSGRIAYVELPSVRDAAVLGGAANLGSAVLTDPTVQKEVQMGETNDEFTEVVSGLIEGDKVIVRVISGVSNTSATGGQQQGFFRVGVSGNRAGGSAR